MSMRKTHIPRCLVLMCLYTFEISFERISQYGHLNLGPCPHPYRTCLRRFVSLVNPLGQLGQQNFFDLFHQLPKPRLTETENAAKFSRTINELVKSHRSSTTEFMYATTSYLARKEEVKEEEDEGEGGRRRDDDNVRIESSINEDI